MSVVWDKYSVDEISINIGKYGEGMHTAALGVANYFAPEIETDAKTGAPWTDRSGNARQGLFTHVEDDPSGVSLYLSHTMEYGLYLETKGGEFNGGGKNGTDLELLKAGTYAIIKPTLDAYEAQVMAMIRDVLGDR